ncbi:MAG TPA: GvpL/GvpF family gas vesicle protein [Acidimicrobiia bacterium]|jgi:hypothetical protein
MGGRTAWYVFGVTPGGPAVPAGVDPTPLAAGVERLAVGEMQAVVSRVPLDELLGDGPQDPAWVLPRIEAHDRVLTAVAAAGAVVPFRFGVVYGSREAVAEALDGRVDALLAALRRVGNGQEWTLSIGTGTGTSPAGRRPPPGSGAERAAASGQGRSYLLARGAELGARQRLDDTVSALRRRCEVWNIPAMALPPGADGACRLACLIPRRAAGEIVSRLTAPTAIDPGLGVSVRGPLPPYHFVGRNPT